MIVLPSGLRAPTLRKRRPARAIVPISFSPLNHLHSQFHRTEAKQKGRFDACEQDIASALKLEPKSLDGLAFAHRQRHVIRCVLHCGNHARLAAYTCMASRRVASSVPARRPSSTSRRAVSHGENSLRCELLRGPAVSRTNCSACYSQRELRKVFCVGTIVGDQTVIDGTQTFGGGWNHLVICFGQKNSPRHTTKELRHHLQLAWLCVTDGVDWGPLTLPI